MECKFCEREGSPNQIRSHQTFCKLNPNRKIPKVPDLRGVDRTNWKKGNQWTKAKELGKEISMSLETRKKISISNFKNQTSKRSEVREKISKTIREKVAAGTWHNSFSKARSHKYKGISLYGSWELKYAQWLDFHSIKWERPQIGFPYPWKGKISHYFPDFYLPDNDIFIEIKGWEVERDKIKWNNFPHRLKVLFGEELKEMGIIESFKSR